MMKEMFIHVVTPYTIPIHLGKPVTDLKVRMSKSALIKILVNSIVFFYNITNIIKFIFII